MKHLQTNTLKSLIFVKSFNINNKYIKHKFNKKSAVRSPVAKTKNSKNKKITPKT